MTPCCCGSIGRWRFSSASRDLRPREAVGGHNDQHGAADDRRAWRAADVERDLNPTRSGEGRARAKLRGQHMGRLPKLAAAQKQEARRGHKDGEAVADLARS